MNRILYMLCIFGLVIFLVNKCYSNVSFGGSTQGKSKQEIQRDSQLDAIYSKVKIQNENINRQTRKTEDSIKQILSINEKERKERVNIGITVSVILLTTCSIFLIYRKRKKILPNINRILFFFTERNLFSLLAIWCFLHVVFLTIGLTNKIALQEVVKNNYTSDAIDPVGGEFIIVEKSKEIFWTFFDGFEKLKYFYDLPEFLLYGVFPLVLFFGYKKIYKSSK